MRRLVLCCAAFGAVSMMYSTCMSFGVKNIMASMPRMYWTVLWLVITISMPRWHSHAPQMPALFFTA